MNLNRRSFLGVAAVSLTGCTSLVDRAVYNPSIGAVSASGYVSTKPQVLHSRVPGGTSVESWYFPPRSPSQSVIAVFHGTGGNIGVIAQQAYPFLGLGYGLFIADYRGYSANPGRPSEAGMIEDAAAQLATLRSLAIAPSRTILFGHSLGGAVTLLTASALEARGITHRGVVTWGAVASLPYMAPPVVGLFLPEKFDSVSAVGSISGPKVFMHGMRDTVVPPDSVRHLANAARPPVASIRVVGAQHDFEAAQNHILFAKVFAAVAAQDLAPLSALTSREVKVALKLS